MGSLEPSGLEIGAYKRSCAKAILGVAGVRPFDPSHLRLFFGLDTALKENRLF